jgi:hypothetical protein
MPRCQRDQVVGLDEVIEATLPITCTTRIGRCGPRRPTFGPGRPLAGHRFGHASSAASTVHLSGKAIRPTHVPGVNYILAMARCNCR